MQELSVEIVAPARGAVDVLESMDEHSRENIGRRTYFFVRRVMQNPELRKLIQERAAQIRAAGM